MEAIDEILGDLIDPSKMNCDDLAVMRSVFSNVTRKRDLEIMTKLSKFDLSPFFETMMSLSDEVLTAYCDVLDSIMEMIPRKQIIDRYDRYMLIALNEKSQSDVQKLALRHLNFCIRERESALKLLSKPDVMSLAIRCLMSSGSNVQATELIVQIAETHIDSIKSLFLDGEFCEQFKIVQEKGSVERLRVLEIYCSVAKLSDNHCVRIRPRLDEIVESFKRDTQRDILVMMNYIQLFTGLIEADSTLEFLKNSSLITDVCELLNRQSDQMAPFYIPGVLEFFGTLGQRSVDIMIERNSNVVRTILGMCEDGDFRCPALHAIGLIARTGEGKVMLRQKLPQEMINLMRIIGKVLRGHGSPDIKISALSSLVSIGNLAALDERDVVNGITESWFNEVDPNPLQLFWNNAKVPFEEIRRPAMKLMATCAGLPWAKTIMVEKLPGFVEWLLDRSSEHDKQAISLKYDVATRLCEDIHTLKDHEKVRMVEKYVREGPFYVPPSFSLATDGA